ncbi:ribonuclease E/G [Mangrovibacillus cuniculi]|uniref:RNA-binding protein AU-1/Ribonuclease E/G domain-containing protein n=1 Tax=Mangrovibacillus cuniculi TaxID=2593652 RepID=A0A7S8CBQ6_9BACI|nr:ribonuclease E/G [Mangrovibacillus cuniculi]QPC47043.1 hypothetical protein G8O30_08730 [Mangrovibacillus cuniculi]
MISLYIELKGLEKRLAVLQDGKLVYYRTASSDDAGQQGSYYIGRIDSVHSGINAAFVEIGEEKKGYLTKQKTVKFAESDHPNKKDIAPSKFLPQGQRILVQVEKEAHGQKGAVLTNLVEIAGVSLVYMPFGQYCAVSKKIPDLIREDLRTAVSSWLTGQEGVVVRTDAANRSLHDLQLELENLREQYQELQKKAQQEKREGLLQPVPLFWKDLQYWISQSSNGECYSDDASFLKQLPLGEGWTKTWHHGKESLFTKYDLHSSEEKVFQKQVWLSNGGSISIEHTEAMTVVDVNTARQVKNRNAEQAFEETNLLAAKEVSKQLLLRDVSGMVVIDFINMKSQSSRQRVLQTLKDQVEKDEKHVMVYPFNELGCVMLTRKRTKPMWYETHLERYSHETGFGWRKSAHASAYSLDRAIRDHIASIETEDVQIKVDSATWENFVGKDKGYLMSIEKDYQVTLHPIIEDREAPYYEIFVTM